MSVGYKQWTAVGCRLQSEGWLRKLERRQWSSCLPAGAGYLWRHLSQSAENAIFSCGALYQAAKRQSRVLIYKVPLLAVRKSWNLSIYSLFSQEYEAASWWGTWQENQIRAKYLEQNSGTETNTIGGLPRGCGSKTGRTNGQRPWRAERPVPVQRIFDIFLSKWCDLVHHQRVFRSRNWYCDIVTMTQFTKCRTIGSVWLAQRRQASRSDNGSRRHVGQWGPITGRPGKNWTGGNPNDVQLKIFGLLLLALACSLRVCLCPEQILVKFHQNTATAFWDTLLTNKLRSVPFRLEVAAYFDKHANAEAKLHLLAQCITFHGSEGSISSVWVRVCAAWWPRFTRRVQCSAEGGD